MRHSHSPTSFVLALGLLAVLAGATHDASAASIVYGDFAVAPGFLFEDVTESSVTDPVPLYGPPSGFAVGLDFDPIGFGATSGGGGTDIVGGQLNFTLTADPLESILSIGVSEAGDFTLAGIGTAATQASAGAILHVTVTQINGAFVAPFNLIPANASVGFNLAANPGVVQPWSLGLLIDIAAQLGAGQRATQIEVAIDNDLTATSEVGSSALIVKKEFRIDVDTPERWNHVPEPSALLLLGAGMALPWAARRR